MSNELKITDAHPSGMQRLTVDVWVTDADMDYITGALVERGVKWDEFVKTALLESAAR